MSTRALHVEGQSFAASATTIAAHRSRKAGDRFKNAGYWLIKQWIASQVFIALCAAALALETSAIAGVPRESLRFYVFIFLATLTSYRLHAHVQLDATQPRGMSRSLGIGVTLLAAGGACVTSLSVGPDRLVWVALAAVLAWLYSVPIAPGARRLREFGIAKIVALAGVWTLITGVLPLLHSADGWTIPLLAARRFLFMFALCLAFDVRDAAVDAKQAIRTLPVLLGVDRTYLLMRATLVIFAAMSLLIPVGQPPRISPGVSCALVASALVTWLVIESTRRRRSPLLFVGGIDGMMLVQSVLVWFACSLPTR